MPGGSFSPQTRPLAPGHTGLPQKPLPSLAVLQIKITTHPVGTQKWGKKWGGWGGGGNHVKNTMYFRVQTPAAAPRPNGFHGDGPAPRLRGRRCPGPVGDMGPTVLVCRENPGRPWTGWGGRRKPTKQAPKGRLRRGNSLRGREVAWAAASGRWLCPPPCCG